MSGRFFNLRAFLKQCVFVFSGLLCGLRGRCEFSFLSCVLIVMHAGVAVHQAPTLVSQILEGSNLATVIAEYEHFAECLVYGEKSPLARFLAKLGLHNSICAGMIFVQEC